MSGYNPYVGGTTPYNNGASMQQMDASVSGNNMMMMSTDDVLGSAGGQTLDDIVNQNNQSMRRQSMPQHYMSSHQNSINANMGRMAMMEFTGASNPSAPLDHFRFDPSTNMVQPDSTSSAAPMNMANQHLQHQKRMSASDLALNTAFPSHNSVYASSTLPDYPSTAVNQTLDMDLNSPFVNSAMAMNLDFNPASDLGQPMAVDQAPIAMYTQPPYHSSMVNSPMHSSMPGLMRSLPQDSGESVSDHQKPRFDPSQRRSSSETNLAARRQQSRSRSMQTPSLTPQNQNSPHPHQSHQQQQQQHSQRSSSSATPKRQDSTPGFPAQPQHPEPGSHQDIGMSRGRPVPEADPSRYNPNNQGFKWETPEGGWPSTMVGRPHMQSEYKNAYSTSGFDMLGVLMRVATRPNPEINIGSVDLSCAFVVCDAEKDDFPIVYCSDNFERLTGYTRHMILGRNCRFLQSPDGNVEPGLKRKYVDDDSVLYLKNMVNMRREAQISLINYRRGGQPFMNLLTMIPISWETDQVKFFVGFQVDLVEQPNAVTDRNADGTFSINYQRGMAMPRYVMNAPESNQNRAELGQTISRDEVSAILATIGTADSDYAKRMWDKVLLENTDDVVHVLSLKGLFQWVSPSCLKVLEYDPGELIGTALSSVCHPSDIVPVTRELKDTSTGASVNVVFRIRRKNSGYMWFEGHGSLHTEQGKGRKSIILVGRERPVYTLSKSDIAANHGIGENELWTKMSTSGMFLFVASNVRQLLDRQPEELVGISIQSLMRSDSKNEFARILEHARTGKKASVKHEMINRRGQVLQAFTSLYPGDATEGQKPTFIVAQTRLIKHPRGNPGTKPSFPRIMERNSSESVNSAATGTPNPPAFAACTPSVAGDGTPQSSQVSVAPKVQFVGTDGVAATYAGQHGLAVGHQDASLAAADNLFDELRTTKSSSWQYEIRQLEKKNRILAEEVQSLLAAKKKRKRRKGAGQMQKDCANCHTRVTPEWRRGPSGQRDLCNSCGLRWAKLNGRVSPRTSSQQSVHSNGASDITSKASASPRHIDGTHDSHTNARPKLSATMSGYRSSTTSKLATDQADNTETSHQGHAAHMEGAIGVPEKIKEDVEPD